MILGSHLFQTHNLPLQAVGAAHHQGNRCTDLGPFIYYVSTALDWTEWAGSKIGHFWIGVDFCVQLAGLMP